MSILAFCDCEHFAKALIVDRQKVVINSINKRLHHGQEQLLEMFTVSLFSARDTVQCELSPLCHHSLFSREKSSVCRPSLPSSTAIKPCRRCRCRRRHHQYHRCCHYHLKGQLSATGMKDEGNGVLEKGELPRRMGNKHEHWSAKGKVEEGR